MHRHRASPQLWKVRLSSNEKGAGVGHEMISIPAHENFKEMLDSWKNNHWQETQRCRAEGEERKSVIKNLSMNL